MTGGPADRLGPRSPTHPPTARSTYPRERASATATALARDLPITRQGIAKHLAVLERAGLVEATRTGREVRFTVRRDRLDQATRHMAQVLDKWDRRLATIKELAEAEHDAQR